MNKQTFDELWSSHPDAPAQNPDDPKVREQLVKAFRKGLKNHLQDYEKILGVKLT